MAAFVLAKEVKVSWPVVVKVPVDGGSFESREFTAVFKVLDQSELDTVNQGDVISGLLDEAVVGLSGLKDETGADVLWSDEVRELFKGRQDIRSGIFRAYTEIVQGRREGNS